MNVFDLIKKKKTLKCKNSILFIFTSSKILIIIIHLSIKKSIILIIIEFFFINNFLNRKPSFIKYLTTKLCRNNNDKIKLIKFKNWFFDIYI